MLRKFLQILLFLTSCGLMAQNNAQQVAQIMEKTTEKYHALPAFTFDFQVNIVHNEKNIKKMEGALWVKKDKYYLSFDDQIIANDGKTLWNYQKNTNEASLFEPEDDEFSMFHPAKLLNNWKSDYYAKMIREEEWNKKKVIIVDLTPKKKSTFYKLRLFLDKQTYYIHQVMMYEVEGATITYTITKFTPNAVVSDDKFIFNKVDYPNVQVNDMR
jgi:outer membrane lipoprotein-sorting protein